MEQVSKKESSKKETSSSSSQKIEERLEISTENGNSDNKKPKENEVAATVSNSKSTALFIFFKVREIVKRAEFSGSTLESLYDLFFEKFPSIKPRVNFFF